MTNFAGLLAARSGQADPRTQLVIGPWTHGVESTRTPSAGERVFGSGAVVDYDAIVLDFLDRYVRDIPNGVESQPRVRMYAMGEDRWYDGDSVPLSGTRETRMLLGRNESSAIGSVSATARRGSAPTTAYTADPQHPVRDDVGTGFGAYNLAHLRGRPDVATFDSAPFTSDTVVLGALTGSLYVRLDRPDADLYLKVLDVAPNGTAYNLMSPGQEVMRISYRHRTSTRENVTPGQVVRVDFLGERTGNMFKTGHRLRVQVVSSWAPDFSRNLQTGKPESTSARTAVARIQILHTNKHPSSVTLPVVKGTLP
jgi:putative CocE/NonD family hydrolase